MQELTNECENLLVPNDDLCYLMNGLIFMHEDVCFNIVINVSD